MARAGKSPAEMFLPPSSKASRARSGPDENPAFQAIWEIVARIPRGQASTYGAVARADGIEVKNGRVSPAYIADLEQI